MKKGQILEGTVERVDFPNKGIVKTEEGAVTVKNVIPGQRIRLMVTKKRSSRAEGRLLETLERSPLEKREKVCGSFPDCGGCTWQTMGYEEQLEMKSGQVRRLLDQAIRSAGQESYCFEGILRSPQEFGYRNKMEFSFGDSSKGGPLELGLHRRQSRYDVLTVSDCRLVHRDMTEILSQTLSYFRTTGLPYYHKLTHKGCLRHLLLRRAETTGEILVCLVTAGLPEMRSREDRTIKTDCLKPSAEQASADHKTVKTEAAEILQEFARRLLALPLEGKIVGILHMQNDSVADIVQSEKTTILYGQDFFYETLLGLSFQITPFSFFQTNSLGAEVLYRVVRDYIGDTKDKTLFDLYSGTGTIAQILAPVAREVIGVEIVEEAVEAARENARRNGLSNCSFLAGDVLKVIDTIETKPDYIVLDPPRDGIHPKALPKIIRYGAEHIIYVSCKPTSLARDLEGLLAGGYRVEKVRCVDMFPGTANCETVCLLSKLKSTHHIEIELNMDELDLTAAEKKATYQEIKDYVLEHTGLKVSSLYIAQIKQKCGIIERENYNKPKSEDARQPQCPPEKEKAIRAALQHFRLIEY